MMIDDAIQAHIERHDRELQERRAQWPGVVGDLASVPLTDVVQLLAMSRRTARVDVGSQSGGSGALFVVDGGIAHADWRDALGACIGTSAFFAMASLAGGNFCACFGIRPARRTITADTTALILEHMRRTDDARRAHVPA